MGEGREEGNARMGNAALVHERMLGGWEEVRRMGGRTGGTHEWKHPRLRLKKACFPRSI